MATGQCDRRAGLVDLADDDRATLYGALLDCAARARGDDAGDVLALWKRRGKRAFDAEAVRSEERSVGKECVGTSRSRQVTNQCKKNKLIENNIVYVYIKGRYLNYENNATSSNILIND